MNKPIIYNFKVGEAWYNEFHIFDLMKSETTDEKYKDIALKYLKSHPRNPAWESMNRPLVYDVRKLSDEEIINNIIIKRFNIKPTHWPKFSNESNFGMMWDGKIVKNPVIVEYYWNNNHWEYRFINMGHETDYHNENKLIDLDKLNEDAGGYIDIIRFSKDVNTMLGNQTITIPGNKLIVVDIQMKYYPGMQFTIEQFVNSLKEFKGDILYFYNGEAMGLESGQDIVMWFMATTNDYSDEFRDLLRRIHWVEKGYGYYRDFMDNGGTEDEIKSVFIYLIQNGYWSTDELSEEEINNFNIRETLKQQLKTQHYNIAVPNFDIRILQDFNGATILGGGRDECYKEIKILMDVMGLIYNEFEPFIY